MSTEGAGAMLSPEEAEQAAARAGIPPFLATLNIFRVLLRRERFAKGFSLALGDLLAGSALDHRLRELAIMRIAWRTGSDYEWTQHWALARRFGVPAEDLLRHGAVSEAVARSMAEGARRHGSATWGIGVTGVAGPDGGTPEKPVGTVHLAVAGPEGTKSSEHHFFGDRRRVRLTAAYTALNQLRLLLR